jgi:hypothetical protein
LNIYSIYSSWLTIKDGLLDSRTLLWSPCKSPRVVLGLRFDICKSHHHLNLSRHRARQLSTLALTTTSLAFIICLNIHPLHYLLLIISISINQSRSSLSTNNNN